MSHPYTPAYTENSELREETARLQQALNNPEPHLSLQVLHEEPARYWSGMFVLADGTDWNPDGLSGEGLYRRNMANNAWVFIG